VQYLLRDPNYSSGDRGGKFGVASDLIAMRLAMPSVSRDAKDQLYNALGEAVIHSWGNLPQDIQHDLFEAAVASADETIRLPLAVLLHDAHPRTLDPRIKALIPEPDSLGG
jgi:hypothetical protein